MTDIANANIQSIWQALDRELTVQATARHWTLVICGGAALLSLGVVSRSTIDIDILDPDIDPVLLAAGNIVGRRLGLRSDWINNGPKSLLPLLPSDWRSRLTPVFSGSALSVFTLGRRELIISKLFAEADRGEDLVDLKGLRPTVDELADAHALVTGYDANPEWPEHVRRVVERIKAALKE